MVQKKYSEEQVMLCSKKGKLKMPWQKALFAG